MVSKQGKPRIRKPRQKTKSGKPPMPPHPAKPTLTDEERLIAHGMAQLEADEPYIWRKILNFD